MPGLLFKSCFQLSLSVQSASQVRESSPWNTVGRWIMPELLFKSCFQLSPSVQSASPVRKSSPWNKVGCIFSTIFKHFLGGIIPDPLVSACKALHTFA